MHVSDFMSMKLQMVSHLGLEGNGIDLDMVNSKTCGCGPGPDHQVSTTVLETER